MAKTKRAVKAAKSPSTKRAATTAAPTSNKTKQARGTPHSKRAPASARSTKTDAVLELLRRPEGASGPELMEATGWQAHSVRGFLSGTVRKKLALVVELVKTEGGESRYKVAAG